jgi:hypothetical protein
LRNTLPDGRREEQRHEAGGQHRQGDECAMPNDPTRAARIDACTAKARVHEDGRGAHVTGRRAM